MILFIIEQIEAMIHHLLMFLYTTNAEVYDGVHGGCVLCVVVVGVCGRPSSFWREIGVSAFTDKKGRRHPEIVSAESGVSGPNCRHHPVSPTCRRHVADICS